MRTTSAIMVTAVLLTSACSGDHPSPTAPQSPAATGSTRGSGGANAWNGSSRVVAITGPENCVADLQHRVGEVWGRSFIIARSDSSISMLTAWGPDVAYVGTVDGSAFVGEDSGGRSANGALSACPSDTYYGGIEGRFAEDERSLTATEFWALRLVSGGEVRWVFDLELEGS